MVIDSQSNQSLRCCVLILAVVSSIVYGGLARAQQKTARPNIVFILADDMGYADLGAYGQKLIKTPHLDRMAEEGIRFTQHYAGSSVCAPSRSVLMTGEHTGHTYVRGNYAWHTEGNVPLPENTATVARLLQQRGYRTGIFGKWGLGGPKSGGGPNSQGFDESLCYLDQREAHDYYPTHLWKNEEEMPLDGNEDGGKAIYSHDIFMDGAMQFIRDHAESPFFLYLPITLPHGRYEGPDNRPYTDEPWSENERHYAAMVTRLDRDMGKVLTLLHDLDIDDNTIVFFTSDNGPVRHISKRFNSNGIFRGHKTELYEGGIRVPLVVKWSQRITPGQTTDHLSAFQDFLPTACELAGVPIPDHIDGISYLPVLEGRLPKKQHDYLYWEYFEYNYNWKETVEGRPRNYLDSQALRMGKWKGIRTGLYDDPYARIALFDLENDPSETSDVSVSHPEIIKQLKTVLDTVRNDVPYFKK